MADPFSALLSDLLAFVHDEQRAANHKLLQTWDLPLQYKLDKGLSQRFTRLDRGDEPSTIWATLDAGESRFREGDLLFLHGGSPSASPLGRGLSLEAEGGERWLLRGHRASAVLAACEGGPCYADPDGMDLTPYYERTIEEIGTSAIGLQRVLPLLVGQPDIGFDDRDVSEGERVARAEGLNAKQAEAVGMAFGAEQVACIQGPPGTGKTRVLALIARLLVDRGERVLVTSHTHMAIHNALNQIHAQGVPTVKVGRDTQRRGLDDRIDCAPSLAAWGARPTGGHVVGATPFATCSSRLESCEFDTVVFDEASQVTVPLALMAMRKGRRYIFIGDHRQLPPVMLSRSVLDGGARSVFAALTARDADHTTMLSDTYRMNRWLTEWPSRAYYGGKLAAAGARRERRLAPSTVPERLAAVFDPSASGVFVPTLDRTARALNVRDAELVVELCAAVVGGGLPLHRIGIVTPYRSQGRAVRGLLGERFGRDAARQVVADTVERMQGQERELVILSLATGDEVFLAAVAPFFLQPERLNVSITRAMSKLIVIGPELAGGLDLEDDTLRQWLAQYRDLVGHLTRVDLRA